MRAPRCRHSTLINADTVFRGAQPGACSRRWRAARAPAASAVGPSRRPRDASRRPGCYPLALLRNSVGCVVDPSRVSASRSRRGRTQVTTCITETLRLSTPDPGPPRRVSTIVHPGSAPSGLAVGAGYGQRCNGYMAYSLPRGIPMRRAIARRSIEGRAQVSARPAHVSPRGSGRAVGACAAGGAHMKSGLCCLA